MEQPPGQSQLPEALTDRGVGVQAVCFALTGVACVAILQTFEGSDFWLYQWFETAVTALYWSFVVPLAALFDWGRKMFERGKAIREAKKAEMVRKATETGIQQGRQEGRQEGREEGRQEGREEGRQEGRQEGGQDVKRRIREALESRGVKLTPDIVAEVFGEAPPNVP